MSVRMLMIIAVVCGTLAALFLVGGLWWWAILGMKPEVGDAVIATGLAASIGSFVSGMIAFNQHADEANRAARER